ncbi:hypothetical protein FOCC_FOCC015867 [Frankliniella occidentalis]|nr:hypothetical protein FOCC_FOCC015867 [Frankliniella occidentalis]
MFDVLNSYKKMLYGSKSAMSLQNEREWPAALERGKQDEKTNCYHSVLKSERKVGFQGFLVLIESITCLFDDLVRNGDSDYLCTYKLSQDRSLGGHARDVVVATTLLSSSSEGHTNGYLWALK